MQARIETCVRARSDPAFVIARCDEHYWRLHTGARTASVEEAIKRGHAYAEAGADALMYPLVNNEDHATLAQELPIPMSVIGIDKPAPDTAFTFAAGWGWLGAAQLHLDRARTLFETGTLKINPMLDGKAEFIEQALFDDVIGEWAKKTGRPVW